MIYYSIEYLYNLYNIISSYNDVRYIAMVIRTWTFFPTASPKTRNAAFVLDLVASKWRWLLEYMKDIEGLRFLFFFLSRSMLQTRSRESKLTMVDYRRVFHHPDLGGFQHEVIVPSATNKYIYIYMFITYLIMHISALLCFISFFASCFISCF